MPRLLPFWGSRQSQQQQQQQKEEDDGSNTTSTTRKKIDVRSQIEDRSSMTSITSASTTTNLTTSMASARRSSHTHSVKIRLNPIMERMKASLDRIQALEESLSPVTATATATEAATVTKNNGSITSNTSSNASSRNDDTASLSSLESDEDGSNGSSSTNNDNKQTVIVNVNDQPRDIHSRSRLLLKTSVEMLQRKLNRLQTLEEMVEQSEDRRQDLQHLFLQTSLSRPRLELASAQSRVRELEQEMETIKIANSILRDQCAKHNKNATNAETEQRVQELSNQVSELMFQCEQYQEDLQQRQTNIQKLAQDNEDLQTEMERLAVVNKFQEATLQQHQLDPKLASKVSALQQQNDEQGKRILELEALLQQHQQMQHLAPPRRPDAQSVETTAPHKNVTPTTADTVATSTATPTTRGRFSFFGRRQQPPQQQTQEPSFKCDEPPIPFHVSVPGATATTDNHQHIGSRDDPVDIGADNDNDSVCSYTSAMTTNTTFTSATGRPSLLSKFFARNTTDDDSNKDPMLSSSWHGSPSRLTKEQKLAKQISVGLLQNHNNNERIVIPVMKTRTRKSLKQMNLSVTREDEDQS